MLRRRAHPAALLVLAVAAVVAWAVMPPGFVYEPLRHALESQLSAALGADVSIERLSLEAHVVVLHNVLVRSEPATAAQPTLSVGLAYLHVDWWSLARAQTVIRGFALEQVEAVIPSLDPVDRKGEAGGAAASPLQWSQVVQRVLDLQVGWCRISQLGISVQAGPDGKPLRLEDGALTCERRDGRLELELSVERVIHGGDRARAGSLRARATGDASELRLAALELRAPDIVAQAAGTLRWEHAPASFALTGGLEMHSAALAQALARLAAPLPEGVAVRARGAVAAIDVHGSWGDSKGWLGHGRAVLTEPVLYLPGARSELVLDALYFEGERRAGGFGGAILADGAGLRARTQIDLPDQGPRSLSGALTLSELEPLHRVLPELRWLRRLRPHLRRTGEAELTAEVRWTPERVEASGRLEAKDLVLHDVVGTEDLLASRFGTGFAYSTLRPSLLSLNQIVLRGPAGSATGWARIDRGSHHLELDVSRLRARVLGGVVIGSVGRGTLRGTLTVDGDEDEPLARVSAQLDARDVWWQPREGLEGLDRSGRRALAGVEVRHGSASVSLELGRWRIEDVAIDGSVLLPATARASQLWADAAVRGRAAFDGQAHRIELEIERLDARVLDAVLPGAIEQGVLRGAVVLAGLVDDPVQSVSGKLELLGAAWRPPPESGALPRLGFERASAELALAAGEWQLSNVQIVSSEGELRGNTRWHDGGHHTAATFIPSATGFFASLVPGDFETGTTQITAEVDGTADIPFRKVRGSIRIDGGHWALPAEAGLCMRALEIHHATADYAWGRGRLSFEHISIDTGAFSAQGTASWRADSTRVDAQLTARRAGNLLDAFPSLVGLVRGGRGSAHIRLEASAAGMTGVVEGQISAGRLVIPSLSGTTLNQHPVDRADFVYEFEPGRQRLRGLRVRGPELNVDLDAAWSDRGPLSGRGRLWLTRNYTHEVTNGAGWALWLLGYPRIDTSFTLSGTARDVRMDATIAHGLRWRLLRIAVPEQLEQIGRGEAPIYRSTARSPADC